MHTPGETAHRYLQKQPNYTIMNEYVKDEWGLTTLRKEEEMVAGGINYRELWQLGQFLGKVIRTVEKYWPSFKHGFVEGWEGA